MDFSVLSQRTVRASPIRSASVNLAPAVPYHTPIRVRLSTPIVALKKRTRIHYQTDEILYITKTTLVYRIAPFAIEIANLFRVSPQLFHSQSKLQIFSGSHPIIPTCDAIHSRTMGIRQGITCQERHPNSRQRHLDCRNGTRNRREAHFLRQTFRLCRRAYPPIAVRSLRRRTCFGHPR